ncbi:MAG: alpha/beta fold hydrolase [Spirochaetales bacterium]|nr:alpha/beta fold hydrolase [Spirochaetales bacterium]
MKFRKQYITAGILLLAACTSHLSGCKGIPKHDNPVFNSGKTLHEIWRIIYDLPLNLEKNPVYPEPVKKYFSYYQLDFEGVDHYFGSLRSGNYLITAHIFMPRFAIETVYLVHGYLLHSGYFNEFIKLLLEHNFAVAAFDLPGHGFSSGRIADIGSFSEYAQTLNDFLHFTEDTFLPPPVAVIGHSAGGAAVIEYMLHYESVFSLHILSAPLVRSRLWDLSRTGVALFQGVVKTVPSRIDDCTSDKEYLDFLKDREPLRRERVPLTWVKALFAWNKQLVQQKNKIDSEILVFQGKKDTVVEWEYNMSFIKQRCPRARIVYFDTAKHEIFKEKQEIRNMLFDAVIKELERKHY